MAQTTTVITSSNKHPSFGSASYLDISNSLNGTNHFANTGKICYEFALPSGVNWPAQKIISAHIRGPRVSNSSSSVKYGRVGFKSSLSSAWNAWPSYNGTALGGVRWTISGVSSGTSYYWWEGDITGNYFSFLQQEIKAGRSLFWAIAEDRTTAGGTTYSIRVRSDNCTLTLVHEPDTSSSYYNGSSWGFVTPHYYDGSAWKQCQFQYYDGSTWKQC